jgi:protein transport protein SEC61 subunit alpha
MLWPDTMWRIVRFLGYWEVHELRRTWVPISGLCYWLAPPSLSTFTAHPTHTIVYTTYLLTSCTLFSWVSIASNDSQENPTILAEDLLGPTEVTMAGPHRNPDNALRDEVARIVPCAATLGALTLAGIALLSDVLGVIGGGYGMLLFASIVYMTYDEWLEEKIKRDRARFFR